MKDKWMRSFLSTCYCTVSSILEEPQKYAQAFKLSKETARSKWQSWQKTREEAMQGLLQSKNHMVLLYASVLARELKDEAMEEFFMPPHSYWLLLELVLDLGGLEELLRQCESAALRREDLEDFLVDEKARLDANLGDLTYRRRLLARMIFAQENGQDVLDSLQYQNIDEMGVLRSDYIYIVFQGRKIRLEGLSFASNTALYRVQKKAAGRARPQYDYNRPALSVDKISGSRVTVAGYLATPGPGDLYFNERLFNLKKVTLETLRDKYGTIDQKIYRLLCQNQRGRGSFLVTGSEMGIGKTTFLSALIEKIPNYWGIGILDTENELRVQEHYPEKNILAVIENPHLSIEEGFRYMLKTSRDVLVVGEITCREEMESLVRGAIRLNAGIGGTLHAAKASLAIRCCANLLKESERQSRMAEENLADSLDLIIHLARHPYESRRIVVEEIVEVRRKELHLEHLSLEELRRLEIIRRLDPKPYELRVLARYDYEQNGFVHLEPPSDTYIDKLSRYVSRRRCEKLASEWRD
ncbi:Flp pilus assembly complex ATPase component TadA [Clostridia bacterium]|nr:Flp pilus assembly complex ATPase component TadA [Clostridia bacterium]